MSGGREDTIEDSRIAEPSTNQQLGNSQQPRPLEHQSHYPRSLEGVLQMAIANTPTGDEVERLRGVQLDPERREFLQNAFAEMCRDDAKVMIGHLATLSKKVDSNKDDDEEECENILEALRDMCDGIDNARDFHKVGGTKQLPSLMDHERSDIRWRTFELIATLVQNVPSNQKVLMEMGAIQMLLTAVDSDVSDIARIKALYAVSCLARDRMDCQSIFAANDGFSVLMRAMQSNSEKLQIKSAFMLQALFQEPTGFKDMLHEMGMVHQLIGLLQSEHKCTHEHFMLALLNLVKGHTGCIHDCLEPNLRFKQFLMERTELLRGEPEFEEEFTSCQELSKLCFSGNSGKQTSVDR